MEEEFPRPQALHPDAQIVKENIYSSSPVRRMALQEVPKILDSDEVETEHFYIKRLQMPTAERIINLPEYFTSPMISLLRAKERMERQKETNVEARLVEFYRTKDNATALGLRVGETIQLKISTLLKMLEMESVVRHYKKLYERHCDWYNVDVPGLVVEKLYFISADSKGDKHGYVIKPRIENSHDITISLLELFDYARASHGDVDELKEAASRTAASLKEEFSDEQLYTLSNEIMKFVSITRKVISEEKLVMDPAGLHSLNILISTDGHIRMIDTDRVYPAEERGHVSQSARNVEHELEALEYVAEYIRQ